MVSVRAWLYPFPQRQPVAAWKVEVIRLSCFVNAEQFKFHRCCCVAAMEAHGGVVFRKEALCPEWLDLSVLVPLLAAG